ncbi:MAG: carboxypeptidase-like regulatory domain-containing protein [Bacteroidia bacterium]
MRITKIIFTFFILIFLFLISIKSYSQTSTVKGFVYEKETGEPVLFINVYLKKTQYAGSTDVNGYFTISKIPPGDYTLEVTAVGYDTLEAPVTVSADEIVSKKLYLAKRTVNLKEVEVSAGREEQKTSVQMGVTKITPREIKQVPAVGGDPDLAQYLQVLPGVISSGDQGGQLYIRGGTPIQNKVLLDGMVIYNPFHSIGLFSVFDTDIIKSADVYTGGFGAEYGGRISSVMDIKTRDGNKKRFGGKFSLSTFNSKLMLEGPIKKAPPDGGGSISYIIDGKTSFLDQSSKTFYNYVDTGGIPYSFNDLYGKIVFNGENGSKLNLFGFDFNDKVKYAGVSDYHWNSAGGGASFVLVPGGSATLIDGILAYSQYKIVLQEADEKERSSLINGFNMGLNFTYFYRKDEIKYGLEVLGFKTNFTFQNYVNQKIEQEENTTEFGIYMRYKKVIGKLVIDPSFRVHYYASLAELAPEPRIGVKMNVTDKFRIKAAAGLYAQNLIAATSDRDVVNLFYGFLSGTDELPDKYNGKEITSLLQKARHLLAGFEYDLPRHIEVNIEGYIKDFYQLTSVNRDKIYDKNADQPDYLKEDYIVETGIAKGVDFSLKYDYKRLYFWGVYSLGFNTRYDGIREYEPVFDRRHNVNLTGSYTFGKKLNWEFNARWNYGSGFPFTQTQGFYNYLNFQQGLNVNYTNANGNLGIQYADLNGGRLPYYHRLDIALKKTFVIGKNSILEATASVVNVYDRNNIFYYDRVRGERVDQLPILPSIGANLSF